MNLNLQSIALNETSVNVALLHKALRALGFAVTKKNRSQNKAGKANK